MNSARVQGIHLYFIMRTLSPPPGFASARYQLKAIGSHCHFIVTRFGSPKDLKSAVSSHHTNALDEQAKKRGNNNALAYGKQESQNGFCPKSLYPSVFHLMYVTFPIYCPLKQIDINSFNIYAFVHNLCLFSPIGLDPSRARKVMFHHNAKDNW
jgi:hypothetical protein